jgi:hypothetical protein
MGASFWADNFPAVRVAIGEAVAAKHRSLGAKVATEINPNANDVSFNINF